MDWTDAPTESGLFMLKPGDNSTPELDIARVDVATGKAKLIHWDSTLDLAAIAGRGHRWFGPIPEPKCLTCDGRGEIGGITASDPGGYSEPCPDCPR